MIFWVVTVPLILLGSAAYLINQFLEWRKED